MLKSKEKYITVGRKEFSLKTMQIKYGHLFSIEDKLTLAQGVEFKIKCPSCNKEFFKIIGFFSTWANKNKGIWKCPDCLKKEKNSKKEKKPKSRCYSIDVLKEKYPNMDIIEEVESKVYENGKIGRRFKVNRIKQGICIIELGNFKTINASELRMKNMKLINNLNSNKKESKIEINLDNCDINDTIIKDQIIKETSNLLAKMLFAQITKG